MSRIIPGGEARAEIIIDKSRFIAAAAPAFSVEEARAFLLRIRAEFPDASHHVPAFVIGHGNSVITHCSDDGEPSGTAGRPALAVLQGSGLGDVAAVITRYFGGIKLGTGGLVRAYSDAMREVLTRLPCAEKVATTDVMTVIPYPLLERIRLAVSEHGGLILDEDFAADVTLSLRFKDEALEKFTADLTNLTRGRAEVIVLSRNPNAIMPLAGTS